MFPLFAIPNQSFSGFDVFNNLFPNCGPLILSSLVIISISFTSFKKMGTR